MTDHIPPHQELTYGFDPASQDGDFAALTVKTQTGYYNFVGAEAEIVIKLLAQTRTDTIREVEERMPKRIDHKDWCDIKASNLGYYNPEDVTCSCDSPAFNEAIDALHQELEQLEAKLTSEGEKS